jgi:hypothetical protein
VVRTKVNQVNFQIRTHEEGKASSFTFNAHRQAITEADASADTFHQGFILPSFRQEN